MINIGKESIKLYCQKYLQCNVEVQDTQTPIWLDNYQIKDCKLQEILWHTSTGWRTDMV